MKKLAVKTQNKRGNEPKYQENLGKVTIFTHPDDFIDVDMFEGFGDSYKQREQDNITITHNGKKYFEGSFLELIEKLNN